MFNIVVKGQDVSLSFSIPENFLFQFVNLCMDNEYVVLVVGRFKTGS